MKSIRIIFLMLLLNTGALGQDYIRLPLDSAGHYAFFNADGVRKTTWIRANEIQLNSNLNFYSYRVGYRWGLIDGNMKVKIAPNFNRVYPHRNLIIAESHNSLVIYNTNFDTVQYIPDFRRIEFSKDSKSRRMQIDQKLSQNTIVKTKDGVGVLDEKMKWLFKPQFDEAFYMEDIIFTRKGERFGFISYKDEYIETNSSAIGTFNGEIVESWDENDKRTYYMKTGEKIPHSDSTLVYDNRYRTVKVYQSGKGILYDQEVNKIINYSGNDIFQIARKQDFGFEQFGAKSDYFAVNKNGKIGMIDGRGQLILPNEYQNIQYEGENRFIVMKNKLFGVVDRRNRIIIPIKYTDIEKTREFYKVANYNKRGLLNSDGEIIVPIAFDYLGCFHEGIITQRSGKLGFYTNSGEKVLDPIMSRAFSANGGFQMSGPKGRCLIGTKGLLTPLNCSEINRTTTTLKYYLEDRIVYHTLENDVIIDTTIYPLKKSIEIGKKNYERSPYNVEEYNSWTFLDQLTGKFGSRNKRDTVFSIPPTFFNLYSVARHTCGKLPDQNFLNVDGAISNTKEVLVNFYGGSGQLGEQNYSIIGTISAYGNSIGSSDPVLTTSMKWKYHRSHKNDQRIYNFIMRREQSSSAELLEGELNFKTGDDLMPFREFYEGLNEGHNYIIKSKFEFDRLAKSPMIKVRDAQWNVLNSISDDKYGYIGAYSKFEVLNSKLVILTNSEGEKSVYSAYSESFVFTGAKQVKYIQVDYLKYLLVQWNESNEWTLYSGFGEKILEKNYTNLEVVAPNIFKTKTANYVRFFNEDDQSIYGYLQ